MKTKTILAGFAVLPLLLFAQENYYTVMKKAKELEGKEKWEEAVKTYEHGMKQKYISPYHGCNGIGSIRLKQKRPEEALQYAEKIAKLSGLPDEARIGGDMLKAKALIQLKKEKEASPILRNIVERDCKQYIVPFWYWAAADQAFRIGDYTTVKLAIERIEDDPKSPQWINNFVRKWKKSMQEDAK